MAAKAVVVLAEGFEEIEALTPVDVLRRAEAEVTLAGVGGLTIKGAHGVGVAADAALDDLSESFDLIVLPGGMPGSKNIGESAAARELARTMLDAGKLVASICAAPVFTLGAWGMLDNRRATCYQGMEGMFPPSVKFSSERVVVDGNIVTSRGPGTALEFALVLAGKLAGEDAAARIARDMIVK
ncbi:MAG: DJ-1/PfpI family protein [Planctomycetota bacterium]|jgi:4-methyl-5(b-hydroxyethyl)-thiazole monophosphate biosynthesis|nr:DJ-1/PfpI family protein [Planctomycetota bacterium]